MAECRRCGRDHDVRECPPVTERIPAYVAELRRIVADADRSKIARRDVAADSEETSDA